MILNITVFINRIEINLNHQCVRIEKKRLSKRGYGLKSMRNRCKQHISAILIKTTPKESGSKK